MSLLDEARRLQAPPSASCTIGILREGERAAEIAELLADKSIKHATIATILRTIGVDTTPQTVGRHRLGYCRCAIVPAQPPQTSRRGTPL